jgi:hypothetical protein
MALKNPRRITVDGIQYHWKTSTNGCLHLVIIEPTKHRQKIVVNFTNKNHVITPRVVRGFIDTAIIRGWKEDLEFRITESWERK